MTSKLTISAQADLSCSWFIDCSIFISDYTDLAMSTVTQRQSISYTGTMAMLQYHLGQLSGDVEILDSKENRDRKALRVFKVVTLTFDPSMVTLEVYKIFCICFLFYINKDDKTFMIFTCVYVNIIFL